MQIPKIIHQVWVGPIPKPPFLGSWGEKHPDYEYKLWTVPEIDAFMPLKNQHLFDDFANSKEFGNISGLVDILRYEILYEYGGIYIDGDIECLRTLEGEFLESDFFVSYVLERVEQTLSNSVIGCTKNHPIMKQMIDELHSCERVTDTPNIFCGSLKLTEVIDNSGLDVVKLPSHYFHPMHYSGAKYLGDELSFGFHHWMTASRAYKGK